LIVKVQYSANKLKKFEIRNTNFETNPKYEYKNVRNIELKRIKNSFGSFEFYKFGIRNCFGFRYSSFGFDSNFAGNILNTKN